MDVEAVELEEDTTLQVGERGIKLKAGTTALCYRKDDRRTDLLYQGQLAEDAAFDIQGREITVNTPRVVWFYESGKLKYTTAITKKTSFPAQGKELIVAKKECDEQTPIQTGDLLILSIIP